MFVSEALASRYTCRAFRPDPVPRAVVESILQGAARAPSGGNFQPWWLWALAGEDLAALKSAVADKIAQGQLLEGDLEYMIYPPDKEPYASRRFSNGEAMYQALGVARDDGPGRLAQYARNFSFFGAPVGLLLAIDRTMLQGQWADLGIFLQSIVLLAREHGLHTAALESWSLFHRTVREHVGMPDELMLYCGIALGYADTAAPVNRYRADRAPLSEFAVLRGFE
ncbi:nitroreductase [Caulobacter sp. KR2-114]|uniref:nitroreductase n=1 Tax=Caulobacter sp. KR2-114 TaxID=3400912 RepID=UPI003C0EF3FA